MRGFVLRTLSFAVGFPLILAACFVGGVLLFFHNQLPDPITMVWAANGTPEQTMSVAGFLTTAAVTIFLSGAMLGVVASMKSLPVRLQRFLLGVAIGGSLFVSTIFSSIVAGQVDLPPGMAPGQDPFVLAMGSGGSVVVAIIVMFVYQPSELPPPKNEPPPFMYR